MDAMRAWSRDEGKDIKFASGAFKSEIDGIPRENVDLIAAMAHSEAREFITAFHATGSAGKLVAALGQASCG
jgi:hypothetical protein